jgi:hypothetical protein
MTHMRNLWTDPKTGNQFDLDEVPFSFGDRQYGEEVNAIYQRFSCRHENEGSQIVWKTVANGRTQLRNQCARCGALWGTALKRDFAPPDAPEADCRKHEQWEDRRKSELGQARIRAIQRHSEWWRWYESYLATDAWRDKRQLVFARGGGVCEGCRKRPAEQVHHLTYKNAGDEFLFQLVAACKACHERLHVKEGVGSETS